jgi:Domain of unknown function (DUF4157)
MFARETSPAKAAQKSPRAFAMPWVDAESAGSSPVLRREVCPCGGGCPRCAAQADRVPKSATSEVHAIQSPVLNQRLAHPLQAKLMINTPGDQYEQEADRVADQVMRMPEPQIQRTCSCGGGCAECSKKDEIEPKHGPVQMKHIGPTGSSQAEAPPIVHEVLRSPGQPLDAATRAFMESRFGHDFSRVRVHTDAAAEQSARDIKAHAYTTGQNIVFNFGQYAPGTGEGNRLLAHELTHVVQQSTAVGERSKSPSKKLSPSCNSHLVQRAPESPEEPVCLAETPPNTESVCERQRPLLGEPASITFSRTPYSRTQYTDPDRHILEEELKKREDLNANNGADFIKKVNKGFLKIWTTYVIHEMQEATENAGWGLWAKVFGFAVREVLIAILAPGIKAMFEGAHLLAELTEKAATAGAELGQSVLEESRSASKVEERGHELEENTEHMADALNDAISPVLEMMTHAVDYNHFLLQAPLSDLDLFRIPIAIPRITSDQVESLVSRMIIRSLGEQKWEPENREIVVVIKTDMANPGKPTVVGGPFFVGSEALGKPLIGHSVGELADIPLNIELIESPEHCFPYSFMLHREPFAYSVEDALSEELGNPFGGLEIKRKPGLPLMLSGPGGVGVWYHLFERTSPGVTAESLVRPLIENPGPKELQPMRRILSGSRYEGAELFIEQSVDSLRIMGVRPDRGWDNEVKPILGTDPRYSGVLEGCIH